MPTQAMKTPPLEYDTGRIRWRETRVVKLQLMRSAWRGVEKAVLPSLPALVLRCSSSRTLLGGQAMPPKPAEHLPCNDLAPQIITYKARGLDCENTGSRRVYRRQKVMKSPDEQDGER